jgi:hypothetical protein
VIKNVLGEEGRVFVIVAHGRAATVGGNMSKRAAIAVMKHLVETFEAEQANEKLEEQN